MAPFETAVYGEKTASSATITDNATIRIMGSPRVAPSDLMIRIKGLPRVAPYEKTVCGKKTARSATIEHLFSFIRISLFAEIRSCRVREFLAEFWGLAPTVLQQRGSESPKRFARIAPATRTRLPSVLRSPPQTSRAGPKTMVRRGPSRLPSAQWSPPQTSGAGSHAA